VGADTSRKGLERVRDFAGDRRHATSCHSISCARSGTSHAATIAALVVGRSFETSQVLASNDPGIYDALGVGSGIPGPNGTFQTWDDCVLTEPLGLDGDARNAWPLEHCREVSSYLPGSKMVDVELRESAVLALLGLLGFGAALALVGSRRP